MHLHVNIQNQSLKKILKSLFQVFFILICQNYKWIYQAFQGNIYLINKHISYKRNIHVYLHIGTIIIKYNL